MEGRRWIAYRLLRSDFVQFALFRFGKVRFFVVQDEVGKLLVFDFDRAHGITRRGLIDGSYGNNVGSSPEDFAFSAVIWSVNDVNGFHPGHLLGGRCVDALYPGMGIGTLHAIAVQHVGAHEVIGVLGSSRSLHRAVHAVHPLADQLALTRIRPLIRVLCHGYAPPFCCGPPLEGWATAPLIPA